MTIKRRKNLMAKIYVHKNKSGDHCVPYKTLIGQGIGNQVIIAGAGEHLYCAQGFKDVSAAVDEAKRRALEIIEKKFPQVEEHEIMWNVVQEQAPDFSGKWNEYGRLSRHTLQIEDTVLTA